MDENVEDIKSEQIEIEETEIIDTQPDFNSEQLTNIYTEIQEINQNLFTVTKVNVAGLFVLGLIFGLCISILLSKYFKN